jgi:phosphoglycolate phosphatase
MAFDEHNIKVVIWDWNGTLLDDVGICIDAINVLLQKRNLPCLDIARYREIFTFPVQSYYEKAGFDFSKESFDIPAFEFIELYRKMLRNASLHADVRFVLGYFKNKKYRQFILSVMEQEFLQESIETQGIASFFERIRGISNHFGASKIDIARDLVTGLSLPPDQVCLIGDTIHDFEVASDLRIPCILVANGHQSADRLYPLGCPIVDKISDLVKIF